MLCSIQVFKYQLQKYHKQLPAYPFRYLENNLATEGFDWFQEGLIIE